MIDRWYRYMTADEKILKKIIASRPEGWERFKENPQPIMG